MSIKKYQSYDLAKIYKSSQTVFTINDFCLIWGVNQPELVWSRANDYAKRGKLYKLRKGIYAKDKDYNKLELATKIYTPSYVSLETVLAQEGVVFQYYETIFVISYLSRNLKVANQKFVFKKIKNEILVNPNGIALKNGYSIATKERAFLDALYLYKDYYFDNLDALDKNKVFELMTIYRNKQLVKKVKQYFNA